MCFELYFARHQDLQTWCDIHIKIYIRCDFVYPCTNNKNEVKNKNKNSSLKVKVMLSVYYVTVPLNDELYIMIILKVL